MCSSHNWHIICSWQAGHDFGIVTQQQQFGTVKSRTYRDNKIHRNLFSAFAALWLTKQAAYVPYKMYRTYRGLVLPKWTVCKSKWQIKPLCLILLSTVYLVIEREIQWCNVLCYPYYLHWQADTSSGSFFAHPSVPDSKFWHSFWYRLSRPFFPFVAVPNK